MAAKQHVSVRVDGAIWRRVRTECVSRGMVTSMVVEGLLVEWLGVVLGHAAAESYRSSPGVVMDGPQLAGCAATRLPGMIVGAGPVKISVFEPPPLKELRYEPGG